MSGLLIIFFLFIGVAGIAVAFGISIDALLGEIYEPELRDWSRQRNREYRYERWKQKIDPYCLTCDRDDA